MSTQQYSAEASFQARGNTMNGCELIVTEVATGTSDVSHQDAFKNAQSAAQQAAQSKLKAELMKINTGSSCQMVVCGPPGPMGPDGRRGRTGPSGTPGQDGALANFDLPSQFIGATSISIPSEGLDEETILLFKFLADLSSNISSRQEADQDDSLPSYNLGQTGNVLANFIKDLISVKSPVRSNIEYNGLTNLSNLPKPKIDILTDILNNIVEYEYNNEELGTLFKNFILVRQEDQPVPQTSRLERISIVRNVYRVIIVTGILYLSN